MATPPQATARPLTAKEAADLIGISSRTLQRWISIGYLREHIDFERAPGRSSHLKFKRDSLQRFVYTRIEYRGEARGIERLDLEATDSKTGT